MCEYFLFWIKFNQLSIIIIIIIIIIINNIKG
jgi:hypothetical protein